MNSPAEPTHESLRMFTRFAAFYAAAFASLGVFMQFFPVWLHDARGLDAEAASFVLTAQIWSRTIAGPFWAQRVDRSGDPRGMLRTLGVMSLLVVAAFAFAESVPMLFLCSALFGCCYSPQYAILDGFALHCAQRHSFPYTRCRSWGSITFLFVIAGVGWLLQSELSGKGPSQSAPWILGILLGAVAVTTLVGYGLPHTTLPRATDRRAPVSILLRQRQFLLFLLATGLIGGSHGAYYSLSTVHWRNHGIGESVASLLWGEGVVAEILLFWFLRNLSSRIRPTTWMLIGGAGAAVRWFALGSSTDPVLLFAVNWLHGLSFGCTFVGSLQFIRTRIAPAYHATAQGLLGAVSSGICTAICTRWAGKAYVQIGGDTFYLMCGVAVAGLLLVLVLRARRKVNMV